MWSVNWLCRAHTHRESLMTDLSVFFAFTQTFLLSTRQPLHCQVTSASLSLSHLSWGRWKLRTVPCPLLPRGLQALGTVCFACSADWKLFPPSGRWCSVCSPCRRSRKRAAIKSDLQQCLMVAKWCKHGPQKRFTVAWTEIWLSEPPLCFVKQM